MQQPNGAALTVAPDVIECVCAAHAQGIPVIVVQERIESVPPVALVVQAHALREIEPSRRMAQRVA